MARPRSAGRVDGDDEARIERKFAELKQMVKGTARRGRIDVVLCAIIAAGASLGAAQITVNDPPPISCIDAYGEAFDIYESTKIKIELAEDDPVQIACDVNGQLDRIVKP